MTTTTTTVDPAIIAAVERMELIAASFMQTIAAELADLHALVERVDADECVQADPLADYRNTDGTVCWVTAYADEVRVGMWVQACHGDTEWHLVERAEKLPDPATLRSMVNVWFDGTSRWWGLTDAVRVAAFPMHGGGDDQLREARYNAGNGGL